jgi:predicted hydrocarbon binding protein
MRLDEAMTHGVDLLRLVGQMGDRARSAGLDGDQLGRRMGRALGEALAAQEPHGAMNRRDAVHALAPLLEQCGLGGLNVLSATPLLLRVQPPAAARATGRRCGHVAGFLEGALGTLLGKTVAVREIDCAGLGNPYCTFALDL